MRANPLKERLRSGAPVIGIWSIVGSAILTEIIGRAGFDFQILDGEHGVFDRTSLDACVRASEASGCSPLVRVSGLSQPEIQSCLDLGAHGIVVPQVRDYATALEATRATKFAPSGTRGYNPFTRCGGYSGDAPGPDNPKLLNDFGLAAIIVESKGAYADLDAILSIPDLDIVYLGVYDISVALGCMGDLANPLVSDFVSSSVPRIRAAGKAAGLMVKTPAEVERYLALGANFLVYGVDTYLIHGAMKGAVGAFAGAVAAWKQGVRP